METRPVTAGDESMAAAEKPEKMLNSIVFWLAFVERAGNAFGTVASIWATVVLLSDFRTQLNRMDFWLSIVMIFIEAIRVFVRSDFSVNHWLLGSSRALRRAPDFSFARMLARPQEGIRVAVTIALCFSLPPLFWLEIIQVVLLFVIWQLLVQGVLKVRCLKLVVLIPLFLILNAISPAIYIFQFKGSDMVYVIAVLINSAVSIILVLLVAVFFATDSCRKIVKRLPQPGRWIKYITLIWLLVSPLTYSITPISLIIPSISMLLLSLSTTQAPGSNNSRSSSKLDLILHLLFLWGLAGPSVLSLLLPTMLIGNLQFPVASMQVVLSIWRLASLVGRHRRDYNPLPEGASQTMVPSIAVFFALELLQGLSYIVASCLGCWSLLPLISLVRDSGLRGESGYKAVDLYYQRAYHTHTEALFSSEKYTASLASFAIKSLSSSSATSSLGFTSSEMQLAGLCILDTFLAKPDSDDTYKEVITDITFTSKETVPTLVAMLGRTGTTAQDREIRLLAASVIAKLAGSGSLKIAEVPATMKMVSSLLDAESRQDSPPNPASVNNGGNDTQTPVGIARGDAVNEHRVAVQEEATDSNGGDAVCWQRMKKWWSKWRIPPEETDPDTLPLLGMPNPAAENNGGDAASQRRSVQERSCWQRMKKWWSKWRIPPEETDRDTLPVQGMPNPAAENNRGNDDNNTSPSQTPNGIARGGAVNEHGMPVQEEATNSNGGHAASQRRSVQERSCWQQIKKWRSELPKPPEETDRDTLPVLGMRILEKLACDPDYCAEIVKDTTRIITKIKELIDRYCTTNNEGSDHTHNNEGSDHTQQKQQEKKMMLSSLNLVRNLATTGGKTGTTFCKVLWENLSLPHIQKIMSHLERSQPELQEPLAVKDIIAKLALDEVATQEITGSTQGIIGKLMHAFLGPYQSNNNNNIVHSLRMAAGKALVNLTIMSEDNCWAILDYLEEPGHNNLIKDLIDMLLLDNGYYVAGNLLYNLCADHSRDKLIGLAGAKKHLEYAMPRVMEHIRLCSAGGGSGGLPFQISVTDGSRRQRRELSLLDEIELAGPLQVSTDNSLMTKESKQLEAVLCVASQIRHVIPECFAQVIQSSYTDRATLVKKLVDTLNSNMKPCPEYPRMRRFLVEMVISIMKSCPDSYIGIFIEHRVMDALDKVKRTPSRLEKYRVFLDGEGVVAESLPLGKLVDEARTLIHQASLTREAQPSPSQEAQEGVHA